MPQHLERKLAVILHTDIVESTRLVQQDEALAHQRIVETFKQFASRIEEFDGVVHEIRGDALLAVFPRASDAINAALTFQQHQKDVTAALDDGIRPELRVGIAMGEVILADGTITGAGVVLTQRLEQLCGAGEVVIQGAVYETLPRHLPIIFESLGDQKLKGFEEVIRAHRVTMLSGADNSLPRNNENRNKGLVTSPEKPSIAVLPFANRSGDPEQEFFSDGISEDILAELSRFHSLFVIARNSSFRYKG